ncbi:MAG: hypothetical protein KC477_13620, partial [Oceanospirillaceae bacterium]|nr:hypothetical protein [Oceanospirillaceae bacterium]
VVVNLIQNAVDAMDASDPKRLLLSAQIMEGKVIFEVRDSGPGIPDDFLSRLFDPFFTTKPVGQGTGLGLSISYGIVSEHGGELVIQNHPDGGALASLTLLTEERCEESNHA